DVDAVQVEVRTEDAAPADMKLAVIDPGKADATAKEQPAIDTARLATGAAAGDPSTGTTGTTGDTGDTGDTGGTGGGEDLSLQAGVYTPKPKIYSRAQWGADERIRDKASLSYYEVHAGFVHHTVNANSYTAAEVPGIIRGIYSYHVRTRGWSDIGYNFLVDRFGRIWEGRYGGVDRPVVGAHTQGYNQYSFAMSAIGNYDVARPSSAMVTAYGQLFAWKLSLHGVSATSTAQRVGTKTFQAINGHRDAGQTACPGKYLYAMIPSIREQAGALQRSWRGRDLESNFAGSALPDLVLRRKGDGRGMVVPIVNVEGRYRLAPAVDTGRSFAGLAQLWAAGDWDRDGKADVMGQRTSDRALVLYRGLGSGKLAAPTVVRTGTADWRLISPVGDMTGDGWPDLMAQARSGAAMRILPGRGLQGFASSYPAYAAVTGTAHLAAGRWNPEDGAPDSIIRDGSKLTVYYGNGPGGWTATRVLPQSAADYARMVGVPSVNGDWHSDLVARTTGGTYVLLKGTATGLAAPIQLGRTLTYDLMG
ncbi:MAG TPA: N-acetylmuramoyl-L-alanine amidase, partial [Nocardioides sp.]|nr:N-acetylmuramoyl-L-alanine amidase [Nocardioides sp.]